MYTPGNVGAKGVCSYMQGCVMHGVCILWGVLNFDEFPNPKHFHSIILSKYNALKNY